MSGDQVAGCACHDLPSARSEHSPDPVPAFGILLHLLAATAMLGAVLVWGVLALTGVVRPSALGLAVASVTAAAAIAWFARLWRLTKELADEPDDLAWRTPVGSVACCQGVRADPDQDATGPVGDAGAEAYPAATRPAAARSGSAC